MYLIICKLSLWLKNIDLLHKGDVLDSSNVKNKFLDPKNVKIDVCSIILSPEIKIFKKIIKRDECSQA